MFKKLVWVVNVLLVGGLLGGGVIWVLDDDPSDASTPKPTTTTTTEPHREWVPDGPHAADIRRAARGLDLSDYEDHLKGDADDWELGIVKRVTAVNITINTSTGTRLLAEPKGCNDRDLPDGYFESLFDPKDIVMFSNYGGNSGDRDDWLCGGEIILIQEAEEDAE